MKNKKVTSMFLSCALGFCVLFGYGSDLDALGQYDAGDYAYWLAAGISTDYTQEDIENCIQLFCTENLSEAE